MNNENIFSIEKTKYIHGYPHSSNNLDYFIILLIDLLNLIKI